MVLRCERLRIGMLVLMKAPVLLEVKETSRTKMFYLFTRLMSHERLNTPKEYLNELLNLLEGDIPQNNSTNASVMYGFIQIIKKILQTQFAIRLLQVNTMDISDIFQRILLLERQVVDRVLNYLHQFIRHQYNSSSMLDLIDWIFQNMPIRSIVEAHLRQSCYC